MLTLAETTAILRYTFTELMLRHTGIQQPVEQYWTEIERHYTGKKRYYHTLQHLQYMLNELHGCRQLVEDWDTLLFALYYHDIIYQPHKKDNEERSALVAVTTLSGINYAPAKSALCSQHILATKLHRLSKSSDTNIFTDADLAILGADTATYQAYAGLVRKEYSMFPDFLYKPGRRKVLEYFLTLDRIFKTGFFYDKYEAQATENVAAELKSL